MRLRTRLTLSIVLLVTLATFLSNAVNLHLVTNTFEAYLREQQDADFRKLSTDIGTIIRRRGALLDEEELAQYARDARVDIVLQDREGQTVTEYSGLEKTPHADIQTRAYTLITEEGRPIGQLLLSYDVSTPTLERAVDNFRHRLFGALLTSILCFVSIGCLLATYLARHLTQPISAISRQTERLRRQEYELSLPQSTIPEICQLSANLQFLADSLEAQERIRTEYAQDISHELRTPLTNLQLHIEALQDGVIEADAETLSILHRDTERLRDIVERLRGTFAAEGTQQNLQPENLDLSIEVTETLDSFEARAHTKNARLIRNIEPHLNARLDRRAFAHIQYNLLSNALKAIEEGGLIRVSLTATEDALLYTVRDNGVGIAEEDQARIFDRFFRVDSARNSEQGGQGLGLAIVKNLVESMGGIITLSSTLGKGSEFSVRFPRQASESTRATSP